MIALLEVAPPPELAPFVESFWSYTAAAEPEATRYAAETSVEVILRVAADGTATPFVAGPTAGFTEDPAPAFMPALRRTLPSGPRRAAARCGSARALRPQRSPQALSTGAGPKPRELRLRRAGAGGAGATGARRVAHALVARRAAAARGGRAALHRTRRTQRRRDGARGRRSRAHVAARVHYRSRASAQGGCAHRTRAPRAGRDRRRPAALRGRGALRLRRSGAHDA